ncbi:MAG: phage holin family protein [Archangiaceae bacterium]|nr:phage holin family protein [Archangiaceae bacterium]
MSTADHLRAVVESFSALLEGHIKLFKLELAEDAKVIGVQVGKIVAFLPLLFVGYGFLCAALAMALQLVMPAWAAYLIVGLLNVVGGAAGIALAARALSKRQVLAGTLREAQATQSALTRAVRDPAITVEVTHG